MPPQTHPQKRSATVMATALRRTRRPTSAGAMKFEAITWIEVRTPAMSRNEAEGFDFGAGDDERRRPSHDGADVRHHVEQTGNDAGEDRIVDVHDPKKETAGGDDHASDNGHAGKIVA